MTTVGSIEREVKLAGRPGFVMPPLGDVVPGAGVVERPWLDLDAEYFDTADLRLAREGISLRRRTGDGPVTWTLKLPAGLASSGLRRVEFDVASDATEVPAELSALVTAWVRTAPVLGVIDILTHRDRFVLIDADGTELVEIDDDHVSVREGGEIVARFREIEVELCAGGTEETLQAVTDALIAAGAGAPDPMPKVVRALGPRAVIPSVLRLPAVEREASMTEAMASSIRSALGEIVRNDPSIRLDHGVSSVDDARWAARRIRSALRVIDGFEGSSSIDRLRTELRWYSKELGTLRQSAVLLDRIRTAIESIDVEGGDDAYSLVARARGERSSAQRAVRTALSSHRYLVLLDALVELSDPKLLLLKKTPTARAALPDQVRQLWKRARSHAGSLPRRPSIEQVRDLRKDVISLRSSVEVAAAVFGEPAVQFEAVLAEAQGHLDSFVDARYTERWISERIDRLDEPARVVAAELVAGQVADSEVSIRAWRDVWSRCAARSSIDWCR